MKLLDLPESFHEKLAIRVKIGDYLTDGNKPSPQAKQEILKLKKYLENDFTNLFSATLAGTLANNYTSEYTLTFDFNNDEDRKDAVRHLRHTLNSEYIRNVKSIQ